MAEGPTKPPSDDASTIRMLGTFAGTGFEFVAAILLPGALGYWLDGRFSSRPWLMLVGGMFGFGVGLYRLLKQASRAMR
ncbi:MAG: AtpZ/AtpI family protein [Burkholderiales bacterium]|nr:AtpZ/AtpI family protein [Phycisphaerae bacterium]